MSTFAEVFDDERLVIGNTTEQRFIEALQAPGLGAPYWFLGIEKADPTTDDHLGCDAWAKLDVGTIPIQIKSSMTGLRKHRARYGDTRVIVVVNEYDTPRIIRSKTFDFLSHYRGDITRAMEMLNGTPSPRLNRRQIRKIKRTRR